MRETTHDHVIERLPWLLNGTLAEGERREVEEHLAGCAGCRAELSLTRESFELYSTHLPPAVLVAYAETPPGDRLTIDGEAVDRRSVDAHLGHCDDCREELEMVRDSRAALGAEEVAQDPPEANVMPFVRPPAEAAAAAPRRAWLPTALAASLLLTVLFAGGWWFESRDGGGGEGQARVEQLERQLDDARRELAALRAASPGTTDGGEAAERIRELEAELSGLNEATGELREQVAALDTALAGPRENVVYVAATLLDAGAVRGGDDPDPGAVERVAAGTTAYLAMTPDPAQVEGVSEVDYRVLDADGAELHDGRLRLIPASDMAPPYFGLALPTAGLPAGTITVVLSDGERTVGRFAFRVEG